MSESPEPIHNAARLDAEVRRLGATFVLTELRTGLALLDAADVSGDRGADGRRHALAREAHDVVTERLARSGDRAVTLTGAERDEITRLHGELRSRLERDENRGR